MDPDGVSALLSHTPYLTTFKYSHCTKWHGCLHDWIAGQFVQAVEKHCGKNLTDLAITIEKDSLFGDVETAFVSLKGFRCLKTAELDLSIFLGPPPDVEQEDSDGNVFSPRGGPPEIPSGDPSTYTASIPSLRNIMPEVVQEADLFCSVRSVEALTRLLTGFVRNVEPAVGKVVVHVRSPSGSTA